MSEHLQPDITIDPDSIPIPPILPTEPSNSAVSPSVGDPWIQPIICTARSKDGKPVKVVVGARYGDRRRGTTTWV